MPPAEYAPGPPGWCPIAIRNSAYRLSIYTEGYRYGSGWGLPRALAQWCTPDNPPWFDKHVSYLENEGFSRHSKVRDHGSTNRAIVGSETKHATVAVRQSSSCTRSPDHLIRLEEERRGQCQAQILRRLEIDDQLELHR